MKVTASKVFTSEERLAIAQRAKEAKADARRSPGAGAAEGEKEVLAKITAMAAPDRALAERLHAVIKATAPALSPKLWYGMPAYAKNGKIVCHFQDARKFKTRYATLGFSDGANIDEGAMWPVAFALIKLTPAEETRIVALVKRAAS
ncbi:MAG: iron chaperone [Candidatus Dormibacteraceae bacterium]